MTHLDFMIGSGVMNVDGITADGTTEPVMRNGEWAFEV
jgi:aminopeptidase